MKTIEFVLKSSKNINKKSAAIHFLFLDKNSQFP